MCKIYVYEHQNERRSSESLDEWLSRVKKCRDVHQRPLMDAIDVLMVHLAETYAIADAGHW